MYHQIIIPAMLACLFSCRELYNDFQPELNEEYLVVEGMISDDPGPYYVKLSKALPYSNDMNLYKYRPEPETQAVVKIRSDKGEDVILHEMENSPGTYSTRSEELTGEVGHGYWLYIETQQGDVYESLPSILMDKPDIPDLYAAAAENTIVDESLPWGPEFVTKQGMQISCDILNNTANYVKIDIRKITLNFYYVDTTFIEAADPDLIEQGYRPAFYYKRDTFYCWTLQTADPVPIIVGTGNHATASLLAGVPLGFITQNQPYSTLDTFVYEVDENYLITDINRFIDSGIIQQVILRVLYNNYYLTDVKAYAINDTIYDYYRNLKNQVNASNKIFDPIPAELKGNIRCTSDPGKSIYGIFTTASVMKKQFFIKWSGKSNIPVVKKLNDYYDVQSSGCATEPPGFWMRY
jgi:hypothetical protein